MQRDVVLTESPQGLTTIADAVCTSVCTSDAENANDGRDPTPGERTAKADVSGSTPSDALAALAAAVGSLSAADRAALVAMIGQAPTPNEPTPHAGPFNRCENGTGSGEGP